MTHPTHEDPDGDGIERTGPVAGGDDAEGAHAGGDDDAEGAQAGGEGGGFLDKVREFFTGGPEDSGSDDDVEEQVETDPEALSGWDGSGEPPELTVPENDAVPAPARADDVTAPAGATVEDEDGGAYESRHGNGVDDSGVLADAPLADDESDAAAAQAGDDEGGTSGPGDSGPDEVRDGGHGWGSAAPLEGSGMPLGHPIKAWHDTMTYVQPGEDGYEDSDPHEWFVDGAAAQRAGFRHAHGG